jgi:hypothetical protein
MDARLSHALVAAAAVALTVVGYTIADGVASTVRGLAGDGAARVAKEEKPDKPEKSDKGDRPNEPHGKGDNGGKGDEGKGEKAPRPEGAEPPGGGGKLAERAEEMGVDARDLREQLAAEAGMTLDQYKKRRQGRSDWRSQQDPEELAARRDARQDRKEVGLTPEEQAELDAQRQLRRDVAELDPTLKDAAGVLKALRQVGEGYEPPADAPIEDEEPLE